MELEAIYIHKCESYHTAARRKDKLRDHSLTRQGKCITVEGRGETHRIREPGRGSTWQGNDTTSLCPVSTAYQTLTRVLGCGHAAMQDHEIIERNQVTCDRRRRCGLLKYVLERPVTRREWNHTLAGIAH
jgi:hypothetical protein